MLHIFYSKLLFLFSEAGCLYIYGWLQVTGEVLDIMNSLPAMVQNMTGVDIKGRMAKA